MVSPRDIKELPQRSDVSSAWSDGIDIIRNTDTTMEIVSPFIYASLKMIDPEA
jgi:hypothetical protein